ncbi:Aste57867_12477 [Aphanomyces stellatus]|uniref:Aste57867_12477 protein n=1 Tax=Aphanomyces stellatus TaxID=120398 RepID=A0A485KWG0_9STRA|nr:hypothetical protein As57867_012431 [Aphanomyces stellatus]VFT89328.1 Aste57867_12477 [Aphanomyces stellatus]
MEIRGSATPSHMDGGDEHNHNALDDNHEFEVLELGRQLQFLSEDPSEVSLMPLHGFAFGLGRRAPRRLVRKSIRITRIERLLLPMDAFLATVFADDDAFSFCDADARKWMAWIRPSTSNTTMLLNVVVHKDDDYVASTFTMDLPALEQHMHDLGVTSDLHSFAVPFKAALTTPGRVHVDCEADHPIAELTYAFGPTLTRKGHFLLTDRGATMPRSVVDLLMDLHASRIETPEQRSARRARRTHHLQSSSTAPPPLEVASQSPVAPSSTVPLKRKALPLGARYGMHPPNVQKLMQQYRRRRVVRGAKFDSED